MNHHIYGAALHFYALKKETDSKEPALHGIINVEKSEAWQTAIGLQGVDRLRKHLHTCVIPLMEE